MALLPQSSLPHYNTNVFHYDKEHNEFTQEASSLPNLPLSPIFGRVYDDACDQGLVLVSQRTGMAVTFVVTKTLTQSYGDETEVQGWELKPVEKPWAGMKMVIFND